MVMEMKDFIEFSMAVQKYSMPNTLCFHHDSEKHLCNIHPQTNRKPFNCLIGIGGRNSKQVTAISA